MICKGVKRVNLKRIGGKLVELRGAKSREQVAVDNDISYSALVSYELGKRIPRDEVKIKLARYYNVNVSELFFSS